MAEARLELSSQVPVFLLWPPPPPWTGFSLKNPANSEKPVKWALVAGRGRWVLEPRAGWTWSLSVEASLTPREPSASYKTHRCPAALGIKTGRSWLAGLEDADRFRTTFYGPASLDSGKALPPHALPFSSETRKAFSGLTLESLTFLLKASEFHFEFLTSTEDK